MYSMDPKANKENPDTPSPYMTLHEQLIYKIAALDASVQQGFRRLDERIDRFQTDLHDNQIEFNERITRFEGEVEKRFLLKRANINAIDTRLKIVEDWKNAMVVRFSLITAFVVIFWMIFGDVVKQTIGITV